MFYDQGKYRLWYSSWTTCDSSGTPSHGTKGDACSTRGYWPCTGVASPQLGRKGRVAALMYAESKDGVTWTKPALGVVSDSSTVANTTAFAQNNIVVLDSTGSGVLVDEHAPPGERYKLFGELNAPAGHKHSRALGVSADGIHWDTKAFAGSSASLDRHGTHNNLVFDALRRQYFGFGRPSNTPFRIAGVAHSLTSDFLGEWSPSVACGLEKAENATYQPDALVVMSEPYASVWLGFANMLSVTTPTAASSAGTTELELVYSTDLLEWRYVAHGTPFIPRGAPGSYDCCELFGAKQQPVVEGDRMKVFYTGGNGPFMGSRAAGFSVATLQRDWWFRPGFLQLGFRKSEPCSDPGKCCSHSNFRIGKIPAIPLSRGRVCDSESAPPKCRSPGSDTRQRATLAPRGSSACRSPWGARARCWCPRTRERAVFRSEWRLQAAQPAGSAPRTACRWLGTSQTLLWRGGSALPRMSMPAAASSGMPRPRRSHPWWGRMSPWSLS